MNKTTEQGAVEMMVEWFRTNYEEPVDALPHESREGGYIYHAGGPYDALEELSDQFGGQFSEVLIKRAADEANQEGGPDWVRKGQY